jgi:hypothetical protein
MRSAQPSMALPLDYTTLARTWRLALYPADHVESASHCHQASSGVRSFHEILRSELLRVLLLSVLRASVFWRGEASHLETEI